MRRPGVYKHCNKPSCDPFLKESLITCVPPVWHGLGPNYQWKWLSECTAPRLTPQNIWQGIYVKQHRQILFIPHVKYTFRVSVCQIFHPQPTIFLLPGRPRPHGWHTFTAKVDFYEFLTLLHGLCISDLDLTPLSGRVSCHDNHNTHITIQQWYHEYFDGHPRHSSVFRSQVLKKIQYTKPLSEEIEKR